MPDERLVKIYPRAWVDLASVVRDDDVLTGMAPGRAQVQLNPHHQAATAEILIDISALPFDPRTLNGVCMSVYMGVVTHIDASVRSEETRRFVGYVDEMKRQFTDKGPQVRLKARDYSSVFRDHKNLTAAFVPRYTDTVVDAIHRVMRAMDIDTNWLEISDQSDGGRASSKPLSSMVAARAAKGFVPIKGKATAWEVIEHVAGIASLLISIDLQQLIIREPRDVFTQNLGGTAKSKYTFLFGEEEANTFEAEDTKKFLRNRKGVKVVAFDPVSRRAIEAVYPANSALPPKRRPKLLGVAKATKTTHHRAAHHQPPPAPDRDIYALGGDGIHTIAELERAAERIYRERSHQELEGSIETKNWVDDIFDLRNADLVDVKIKPKLEAELRNTSDPRLQIAYLKTRLGVTEAAARVLLAASQKPESTVFGLRSITHEWTPKGAKSKFDYIGLIG